MEFLAATAAGGALFLFLAYMVRARVLRPSEARIRVLATPSNVTLDADAQGSAILRRMPTTPLGKWLSASKYSTQWQQDLERAGLALRPYEYFLVRLALGAATVLVVTLIGRNGIAFAVSLPLGAIMYMLPAYWVRFRIMRRVEDLNKQLVETITLIANGLRAGFAFSQSIDVTAKRVGPPMSQELGRMLLDVNLGMSVEDALREMNARIGSDDVDMVVTAILIQRQSGGNLAEVLENVTETMRDRERIQGEIRTMTSQQRLTGWILSLWPVGLGLAFAAFQPDIMKLFFTMELGRVMLAAWAGLWVIGVFLIRRILDIDV
jgi:tight adherence protein B